MVLAHRAEETVMLGVLEVAVRGMAALVGLRQHLHQVKVMQEAQDNREELETTAQAAAEAPVLLAITETPRQAGQVG